MGSKTRITWDHYWMSIAKLVSKRSTCLRQQYGAILVKNNQIISSGYNGAVKRATHCIDTGNCIRIEKKIPSRTRYETCNAVHAEQNCLINCKLDKSGASLYVNGTPCIICAKMLVNSDISKVVYINDMPKLMEGIKILEKAKIPCVRIFPRTLSS